MSGVLSSCQMYFLLKIHRNLDSQEWRPRKIKEKSKYEEKAKEEPEKKAIV
jgi:hypothetical protein